MRRPRNHHRINQSATITHRTVLLSTGSGGGRGSRVVHGVHDMRRSVVEETISYLLRKAGCRV